MKFETITHMNAQRHTYTHHLTALCCGFLSPRALKSSAGDKSSGALSAEPVAAQEKERTSPDPERTAEGRI